MSMSTLMETNDKCTDLLFSVVFAKYICQNKCILLQAWTVIRLSDSGHLHFYAMYFYCIDSILNTDNTLSFKVQTSFVCSQVAFLCKKVVLNQQ